VIDFTGTIELLKGGRLRVLAITAPARDAKFPDIPTMKESGFTDFETAVWSAFFMRADTPDDVVEKLAGAIQKVMTSDAGKAYHASLPSQPMNDGPEGAGRVPAA
jgi:tripartite-type tricarboxylate transporter receptor subunit TctC